MGAYSPLPFITAEDERYAMEKVMQPVADAMVAEGCPFGRALRRFDESRGHRGSSSSTPVPDRAVLPRLKADIVDIFCAGRGARDTGWKWHFAALGIDAASKGYRATAEKGFEIKGTRSGRGGRLPHGHRRPDLPPAEGRVPGFVVVRAGI